MNARILASLLVLATGCLAPDPSVVIKASCSPPTPAAGGCVYSATCTSVWLDNLWFDPSYAANMYLDWTFRVDNGRPDNVPREGGTSTAAAYVTGYKLKFSTGAGVLPDVTIDWTAQMVPPAGSAVVAVPVIPPSIAALTVAFPNPTTVKVEIRAIGHYGDGAKFESGPFDVVVDVRPGRGAGPVPACTAPATPQACPGFGQSNVSACL